MPTFPNLGDFGLTTPTQSSGVGSDTPAIDALMGTGRGDLIDEVGKSRILETELARLRQTQPEGLGDILKSPGSLAAILGGIAGIAGAGGQAGRAAGIGALLGTLQKAQTIQEAERTQLSKAREETADLLETSFDRQDKIRNRLAQIYNTNPEAFQGPDGQAPDPEVLGWYLTGTANLPVWTSTRRALNERQDKWDKRTDLLVKGIETSQDPGATRMLMKGLLKQLDVENPTDEMVDAYTSAFGTPQAGQITWKNHYTNFGISARDAHLFAVENGNLSPSDPRVLKLLRGKPAAPAAQLSQLQADTMAFVRGWEKDPTNAQRVLQIRAEATDSEEAQRTIIQEAMQSSETYAGIDAAFLIDKINVEDPDKDLVNLLRIYSQVQNRDDVLNMLMQDGLLEALGMTRDEFIQGQKDTAVQEKGDMEQAAKNSDAQWTARQQNDISTTLAEQVPGYSTATYLRSAVQIVEAAKAELRIKPGDTIDRAALEAAIKAKILDAVQDLKDFKPKEE
jgi:hypothetical protein